MDERRGIVTTIIFHWKLMMFSPLGSECSLAVASFDDKGFQHFSFVNDRPRKVVRFTIDLHEDLVQMPSPI